MVGSGCTVRRDRVKASALCLLLAWPAAFAAPPPEVRVVALNCADVASEPYCRGPVSDREQTCACQVSGPAALPAATYPTALIRSAHSSHRSPKIRNAPRLLPQRANPEHAGPATGPAVAAATRPAPVTAATATAATAATAAEQRVRQLAEQQKAQQRHQEAQQRAQQEQQAQQRAQQEQALRACRARSAKDSTICNKKHSCCARPRGAARKTEARGERASAQAVWHSALSGDCSQRGGPAMSLGKLDDHRTDTLAPAFPPAATIACSAGAGAGTATCQGPTRRPTSAPIRWVIHDALCRLPPKVRVHGQWKCAAPAASRSTDQPPDAAEPGQGHRPGAPGLQSVPPRAVAVDTGPAWCRGAITRLDTRRENPDGLLIVITQTPLPDGTKQVTGFRQTEDARSGTTTRVYADGRRVIQWPTTNPEFPRAVFSTPSDVDREMGCTEAESSIGTVSWSIAMPPVGSAG